MIRTGVVGWPQEAADRYVASGLWRRQPLGGWVWSWADRYGHRTAVVDGSVRLSYREVAERVDSLAERLLGLGMRNGDNLLVQLPNCWEFLGLFLACQRIGVAPLLALPAHREHELAYLADLAEVAAIVVPDPCAASTTSPWPRGSPRIARSAVRSWSLAASRSPGTWTSRRC
ncbi:AMP-binding protein [Streptomyces sp. NPDC005784]|uniref:AMP-binding protein n=1 Tax=Streptomyces sp. NPDC005784 TaxID=3364731 RepID=UPI0036968490